MKACRPRSWTSRIAALVLVPAQILATVPQAFAAQEKGGFQPPPAPTVKVNRALPEVPPPSTELAFSSVPTDDEFRRARVFEEPLIPVGTLVHDGDAPALAQALLRHRHRASQDDFTAISGFLERYPRSRWRPVLLLNLGLAHYAAGYFSRALAEWEEVWSMARNDESVHGRAIADRALGEIAAMNARVGRMERLETLFEEIKERDVRGPARVRLVGAREGLHLMKTQPGKAFRCGPYALDRIRAFETPDTAFDQAILDTESTRQGLSLLQVRELAGKLKMAYRMARREPGAAIVLPAVAHWKLGHFAAIVQEKDGRYLIQDPTFGDDLWVTKAAFDEEGSGYFLVPEGPLSTGWHDVGDDEGGRVWGKGHLTSRDPRKTRCDDTKAKDGSCGGSNGMATWDVHAMLVSLTIGDTPVGYTPPKGPSVYFSVTYNHHEAFQPSTFTYSNLGHMWTSNWLSLVVDNPASAPDGVVAYLPGGGSERHSGLLADGVTYKRPRDAESTLKRISLNPPRYEYQAPDGSKLVFSQGDGATAFPRNVFLTEVVDPQRNRVTLTYDDRFRVRALRDALGQITTLHYELAADEYKVTKVTDPFGRSASFVYDYLGRLIEIRDVVGMSSGFTYGSGGLISSLTTPYGTTRFEAGGGSLRGWIEIADPTGQRERVEYREHGSSEPASTVPGGVNAADPHFYDNNTFYWDSRAYVQGDNGREPSTAKWFHWLAGADDNPRVSTGILGAIKKPLENRTFFQYEGQPREILAGTSDLPRRVARVLSYDPATNTKVEENHQYLYNEQRHVTQYTDPQGRVTDYEYDANDIDLLRIRQQNPASPAGSDLLWSATYNGQHLPLSVTDAAGQTTTFTYNTAGQLQTVTTPARAGVSEGLTTTLSYDFYGYLQSVSGPTAGSTVSFTYDGYGRPRTITNADDYTVTVEYDGLDRPTKVFYPNGTYEAVTWDKLDVKTYRDLMGRVTEVFYDAVRRPTAIRNPLGRTTSLGWCNCGGLERIIDSNGNATTFERDLQGRVTKEVRADQSYVARVYEATTSRLASVEDARRAKRAYKYNRDGTLARVDYVNGATNQPDAATPAVALTFDPVYRRLATRVDGGGTTTYGYHPVTGAIGSGRLGTIDGPLPNDTVSYGYDELGRVTRREIGGVPTTVEYDPLGRVGNVTNALGAFTYGYQGATGFLTGVTGPNGLSRSYAYFDKAGDRQLREITNRFGANVISRHSYTYTADNEIASWTQETGGDPSATQRYALSYDAGSQLTSALLSKVSDGTLLKSFAYSYDKSFNRTSEQIDSALTSASHSKGDQLVSHQTGGSMVFEGTTTEPASVTVAGRPAKVGADGKFRGQATVASGTQTIPVAATDHSGNTRTYTYEVTVAGGNATLTYDLSGNLRSDGTRTYEWDLLNRLTAINNGPKRSEFEYDGFGRRTRIVEKDGGAAVSDKRYLWEGEQIVEERNGAGDATLKRYFGQGVQQGGQSFFYTRDHLGSVREVVDLAGAVRARYDYDPYGRKTKISGDVDADFGFTNYFEHVASGLKLAAYRAYDPNLGRFLSRDPIGLGGGINLYAYVGNNPISRIDPLGLSFGTFMRGFGMGLAAGVAIGAMAAAGPFALAAALALGAIGAATAYYEWQAAGCDVDKKHEIAGGLLGGAIGGGFGYGLGQGLGLGGSSAGAGPITNPARMLPASTARAPVPRQPGPTTNPSVGRVGRFIGDENGNVMVEPPGGSTIPAGRGGVDTHTRYPNGSNCMRLNPRGHPNNPVPHGHGHQPGTGPNTRGQGPSVDPLGSPVPWNSPEAHWPVYY